MTRFLLVCLGGAAGSGARFLIASATPYGTLIVNVIGSFAIAVALDSLRSSDLRLMLVTGVLGGFTTYSAFNQETLELMRAGSWGRAFANVAVTLIACLLAGAAGIWFSAKIR